MNDGGFSLPLIHDSIPIMTPLLLAGMGGLMTELAGTLNISLEGLMLIGAFSTVVFASLTGSLIAGLIIGILITMSFSMLLWLAVTFLKSNLYIAGLGINLLAGGLTVSLSYRFFDTKSMIEFGNLSELAVFNVPALHGIPLLGDILFGHNVLVYIGWMIAILAYVFLYKTPYGLWLIASGKNSAVLLAAGVNPKMCRLTAILISGFTCALAGAMLTLSIGAYTPNITAGRGWTALVLIWLGARKPQGILISAFVFGLAESFANYAQGYWDISTNIILAFPYVLTLVAMVLMAIVRLPTTAGTTAAKAAPTAGKSSS